MGLGGVSGADFGATGAVRRARSIWMSPRPTLATNIDDFWTLNGDPRLTRPALWFLKGGATVLPSEADFSYDSTVAPKRVDFKVTRWVGQAPI